MTLTVENLGKSFSGTPVIKGLNFHISKGELVGLVGPNGAGKSTTLSIICGVIPADEGHVFLSGDEICRNAVSFKKRIAFVPDRPGVYESLTGFDLLKFSVKTHDKSIDCILDAAQQAGCQDLLAEPLSVLSRGQCQAVYLAAAFASEPEVLLLDEPTVGLDPIQQQRIMKGLEGYCKKGGTVLLSTHALYEAEQLCDRILVLMNHEIIADGSAKEISKDHNSLYDYLSEHHHQPLVEVE